MTTMILTDTSLLARTAGRTVELEELEVGYKVRALVQFRISPDVARAFGFSEGELSTVKMLARRRRLITG